MNTCTYIMQNDYRNDDSFRKLKQDVSNRYAKNELTTEEFVSLIDEIKEAEKDGYITVQEVRENNLEHIYRLNRNYVLQLHNRNF